MEGSLFEVTKEVWADYRDIILEIITEIGAMRNGGINTGSARGRNQIRTKIKEPASLKFHY